MRVVRHHDDRLAVLAVQRLQQVEDFVARLAIEIAGRLVAQQQRRVRHDRAGDADALFLAARQLAGIVLRRGRRGRPPTAPSARGASRSADDSFVSSSGSSTFRAAVSTGSRLYIWKTKPMCRARQADEAAARHLVDAVAGNLDRAFRRRVEPADQVEQRRLARARRSHQREEIPLRNLEVDPLQHVDALASAEIHLVKVPNPDQRFHQRSFTRAPSASVGGPSTTTFSPALTPETIST